MDETGERDGTAPHTTVWWARRPSDRYRAMFRQRIVLLNKPFRVLSQFTDKPAVGLAAQPSIASSHAARETLSEYIAEPPSGIGRLRPAGRLDYDSEGLLVLTDDRQLQQRVQLPQHSLWKTYWVQVLLVGLVGLLRKDLLWKTR